MKLSETQIRDIITHLNNSKFNKPTWVCLGRGDTFKRPIPRFRGYFVYQNQLEEQGISALTFSLECRGRDPRAYYFVTSESILALENPEIVNSLKPLNIAITKFVI
ncbi:MAG: hypothetical protein K9G65_06155 [Rickettsiaceae bacterium]|nr:hypothetical protein [Rickettsiaceae bacterium]